MEEAASRLLADTTGWMRAGLVEAAWVRPERRRPPELAHCVKAITGLGIDGDCHLDPLSPRQVLLASADTYRRFSLPPASLRETFTVSAPLELYHPGSLVSVGDRVLLRITFRCEPCARLNEKRPGLMKAIGCERGVLARVVRGGQVCEGAAIRVLPRMYPVWSDVWQERVYHVAGVIPKDTVLEYRQLARLVGVPLAYCRVFPRILAAAPGGLSDRVVASSERPEMPRWSGEGLYLSEFDDVLEDTEYSRATGTL